MTRWLVMLYNKYITYRNKKIEIKDLRENSTKKIEIVCPDCNKTHKKIFRILAKSGNFLCQSCTIKDRFGNRPEIGYSNNMLTLISHTKDFSYSLYRCECGNTKILSNMRVRSGHICSCGCLKVKAMKNAKKLQNHSKENHPNWKGGISEENNLIRTSKEYKKWRNLIFKRDGYKCVKCGQIGGSLNAHHIKEFANNRELIYNIDNGVTFCENCHRKFHKEYGKKNLSKKQVIKFIGA